MYMVVTIGRTDFRLKVKDALVIKDLLKEVTPSRVDPFKHAEERTAVAELAWSVNTSQVERCCELCDGPEEEDTTVVYYICRDCWEP